MAIDRREEAFRGLEGLLEVAGRGGIGLALTDAQDRFIYVNEGHARIYGLSREEMLGKTWRDLTPPEAVPAAELAWRRCIERGEVLHLEIPGPRGDGTSGHHRVAAVPLRDAQGDYSGHLCIVQDVTEWVRAEEALRESDHRYRALADNALASIFRTTLDGRILYVNQAMAATLGYEGPEEVCRLRAPDFYVSPARREELLERLRREGSVSGFEVELRTAGGEVRTGLFSVTLQGDVLEGMFMDITERVRAELELTLHRHHLEELVSERTSELKAAKERLEGEVAERRRAEEARERERDNLRSILDSMEDGVCITDEGYNLTYANPALQREFGPPEGRKCYEYFHGRAEVCPWCPNQKVLAGQTMRWEWLCQRNNKTYDIIDTPYRNPDGTISKLEILRDITARKQAEQGLRASEQMLKLVMDSIPQAIFWKDRDSVYLGCNGNFVRDVGLSDPAQVVGKTDYDLPWKREEADFFRAVDRRVMETGTPEYGIVEPASQADGRQIWAETNKVPLRDASGRVVGILGTYADVTERKRAEEEIKTLARFPAENPSPVLRVAQDGTILLANEAGSPLLATWGCGVGQPLPARWREFVAEALRSGSNQVREVECGARTFALTLAPVQESGYVNLYGLDITERLRAEEALRRSQERYALAQRAAGIGSWDWDIPSGALKWSDAIEPMFGFAHGQFGRTYQAFLECVHPEDRQLVRERVEACIEKGEDYDIEHRIVWPGGAVRWVSETGDVIRDETGRAVRMLGVVQDITERKRAEAALASHARLMEATFEGTRTLLVYLDRDFNFVKVNDAYADACARPKEEFPGRNHFELYPSDAQAIFERVRDTGQPYTAVARPFVFPDHPEWGETFWDWTLTPVKDARGWVEGFVFSLVDVTERIRQQHKLEEVNRLKDEFLSMASHELKTPVTSIKIFAELAARRPEAIQPRLMETLTRQADQLVRLVNDLLEVSRLELGRMPVEMKLFDLNSFLRDLCDRVRPVYDRHLLRCAVAETESIVHGDPTRLEQVFQNLLDNAAKYSPQGGPIRVESWVAEDGGHVRVAVHDEGLGIPPEHLPHIFERFYKPGAHQAVYSGLGVGLYISRAIVERHGGRIWVESEQERGSTFHVELPLARRLS